MPKSIACPGCRRVLTLPDDSINALVQCPACKQSFHPAVADTAAIRPAPPKPDLAPPPPPRPSPSAAASSDAPVRRARRPREEYDVCPKCRARVTPGSSRCPECNVEFEPDETDRPWENMGEERRDSDPHRGGMILVMGIGSIVVPIVFMCPIAGLVATLVGLTIGILAWVMAVKDMRKMDKHEMDRSGRGLSQAGMICGIIGLALNGLATIGSAWITIEFLLN
jgi:uncharacterized CHY-type Zn-finger protein